MILTAGTGAGATPIGTAQIQIDDAVVGAVDDAGVRWTFTSLSGWWESAPLRDRTVDRPSGDGMFAARPYRTGRIITVTGLLRAESRALVAAAVDHVASIQGGGDPGLFTYLDPDLGPRSCSVTLTGSPTVDASTIGIGMARWQLAFKAADWRKYGAGQSTSTGLRTGGGGLSFPLSFPLLFGTPPSGGRVSFVNTGSASTEPVITVSGPFAAGFEVVYIESGQRLRYVAPVGSDIVLDCQQGTVTTQGQERATNLTIRDWFSVPANSTATFSLTTLGPETALSAPSAGMTVAVAPAYL